MRSYRRITPKEQAEQKALEAELGNGSAAQRVINPTILKPGDRAWRIKKKSENENAMDYIETNMQQIGVDAINRVGKLVNSVDERVATKNAHFVIDHIRGKAVQRQEGKHLNINIEAVLD